MEGATVGGVPIESLTGELAGVWSGWRVSGDREVVREASAKGLHINLAYKFLAHRRGCSLEDAKSYFSTEVEIWVNELLNKRQVHRASHVLKNVGKIPPEFICATCLKCKEPSLRNYLAQHLININGFEEEHREAWEMINLIEEYEERHKLKGELISHKSLEEILNLSQDIKNAIYTELYFNKFDPKIVSKLENVTVWNYLLINNRIDLVKNWISINYESDSKEVDVEDKVKQTFCNLKITEDMISFLEKSNATIPVIQSILNFLCRFGVFTNKEQKDLKLILTRFFSNLIPPCEFHKILSKESSNINKYEVLRKVEAVKHSRNYLGDNTEKSVIKNKNLRDALNEMCDEDNESLEALERGILETISYISEDPLEFLKKNFAITFTLILLQHLKESRLSVEDGTLSKEKSFKEIFSEGKGLKIGDIMIPKEILQNVLDRLPDFKTEIEGNSSRNNVSMYQLLDGYKKLDSSRVFKWREKDGRMPNFSSEYLVNKYGHKEKLTYMNYLKESRPNMAFSIIRRQEDKTLGSFSSKTKSQLSLSAHIFGLRHSNELAIISSCVSFIELLGINSENLRLHVTVAHQVRKELNISIENLLESVVYKNQQDLATVLLYLERSFNSILTTNLIKEVVEFVSALKTWDIIVRFARAHNASLPTSLLRFLAMHDAWIEFILVGQIFSYPSDQILESMRLFENFNLREHLLLSLNNPNLPNSNSFGEILKVKSRNPRQIGAKQVSLEKSPSVSRLCSSLESHSPVSDSSLANFNIHSFINDLWLTILQCHQSQDPPGALLKASRNLKSPILTVLASCYEPSSAATHCYFWLVFSGGVPDFFLNGKDNLEDHVWSARKVLQLFDDLVSRGFLTTLYKGLSIFMPENPLRLFFEFLVRFGFDECKASLINFIASFSTLKCNKNIDWETDETYLDNVYWIETVVVKCIITALGKRFQSRCLQIKFLETLTSCDFSRNLTALNAPDFKSILEILKILMKTDIKFNFMSFDTIDNEQNFTCEIERCINELLKKENYTSALELSRVAQMKPSKIILAQYRSEFKKRIGIVDSDFWKRCSADFKLHHVCYTKAAEFFVEHAEKVQSCKERFEILKLALEILKENSEDQQTCDKAEMAMWKSCVLAGPENIEIENQEGIFNKLKTELLSDLNNLQITCTLSDPLEKAAIECLINRLLDAGRLDTALRISAIFNYKHKDVQILMLCLSLAEGEITPYQLTVQQRMLISELGNTKQRLGILRNRGLPRLSSSSSLNLGSLSSNLSGTHETASEVSNQVNQEQSDCMHLLTKLLKSLKNGITIGTRVMTCYKLAVNLGKSYQALLILNDPMRLLKEVVLSNHDRALELSSDIITAYQIASREVAQFLAEEIVASITRVVEDGNNDSAIWSFPLDISLHSVIELSKDTSILGLKLLDIASKLLGHSNGEKRNVITLKIAVELLIRSHDCFTTSCNMEGIASVLRKCQQLANSLQNLKLWSLLVRLVTGVGRFTEMSYVFKILKEHDQFEFLLGKGLDKVPGLRMALLDFVKRHCPDNKELLNIIALHFRLYYEIALTWESEAREIINELVAEAKKEKYSGQVDVRLTRNEITEKRLQLAIANFTHATQYFLQDNKLNLASRCSHQAELVALQISLLGGVQQTEQFTCILNLNKEELDKAICHFLSFPQALILTRAYNHHVDWANAIYNHCLLRGESKYLKEFVLSNKLTTSIVRDCVRRFRLEKNVTKLMTMNMRMLVAQLNDTECKYVVASQFGFKDIIETMLETPTVGSYLKDTVWKKQYDESDFIS